MGRPLPSRSHPLGRGKRTQLRALGAWRKVWEMARRAGERLPGALQEGGALCPALGAATFKWQKGERAVNAVCQVVFWSNLARKKEKQQQQQQLPCLALVPAIPRRAEPLPFQLWLGGSRASFRALLWGWDRCRLRQRALKQQKSSTTTKRNKTSLGWLRGSPRALASESYNLVPSQRWLTDAPGSLFQPTLSSLGTARGSPGIEAEPGAPPTSWEKPGRPPPGFTSRR